MKQLNFRFCKLSVINAFKKNSKFGCDWIFEIIIIYYKLVFLVSVVLLLGIFLFCLRAKDYRNMIFSESLLVLWAIGGQKLGILSIRVHSSLLELWNLITFLNFKTSLVMPIISHYDALRTKIDMWLTISACEVLRQTFFTFAGKKYISD